MTTIPHKVIYITTVDLSLRFLVLNHLKHLKSLGYEVVGVSSPGQYLAEVEAAGIRVIPVPMTRRMTPVQDVRSLLRLVAILRHEKPSIVHTHTPKANLLGQWAAKLAGVPIQVSTIHGLYFTVETPLLRRFVFQAIETASALFAEAVFMINQEDVEIARRLGICDPARVRLLRGGLGIDLGKFDRDKVSSGTLRSKRAELGLDESCKIVGFVGRLVAEKGIAELLLAARMVAAQVPEVRFLFVGPIDYDKPDAFRPDLAEKYGVSNVCVFTGTRQDVSDLYALMDIFVLPSHREGLPLATMEASAMGVPCIVTDIRGSRDVVEHGQNGLLVPLGDIQALADAIVRLLTDEAKAECLGHGGRRIAAARFDENLAMQIVETEYVRLLREHGIDPPVIEDRSQYDGT